MCGKGLFVQSDPGQGRLPVGGFSGVERCLERGSEQGLRREVSFRGGTDTGTAVLLCHGWGGVWWGVAGVLNAGFGFQGAFTHTRSTVETKPFRVADRN